MKPTHGGARKGAGRKPRVAPRRAVTIRLEPDDAARLRAICTERGISQADWLSEKINFDPYEAIDDAAQLLAEIMRDEVNPQDEAEKWIRSYAPHHLFAENAESILPESKPNDNE